MKLKMSKKQEAIAHGQARKGQPLLDKRRQVTQRQPQAAPQVTWMTLMSNPGDSPTLLPRPVLSRSPTRSRTWKGSLESGHSVPPSSVTRAQVLSVSDLPRLHGPQLSLAPPGTQLARRRLGHTETGKLPKVQEGHGDNTCTDLFRPLAPHLRANRPVMSTLSTPKPSGVCQEAEGTRRPDKQTALHKQLCPDNEEDLICSMRKKREEMEKLEEKIYAEQFRAIFSSLQKEESRMTSSCVLRDPSSPTLEPAAGPSVLHSTCSGTKDAAGKTQNNSHLGSLDQLLAEVGSISDDSLPCDAPVKELSENWEQEELPDREAAGERHSEPQSTLSLPPLDKEAEAAASPHSKLLCTGSEDAFEHLMKTLTEQLEEEDGDQIEGDLLADILSSLHKENLAKTACVLTDLSSVTLEPAAGPQVPHSTSSVTKESAGETENNSEIAPADLLAELLSDSLLSCGALLNELLEKWQEEELPDSKVAAERDSEPESVLSLPPQDKEAEPAASLLLSDPCDKGHSEHLPTPLPEDTTMSPVCALADDPAEEENAACTEPGHAQAAPPQAKPCGAGTAAEPCPVPAQPQPCTVPSSPAGMATVPQPPAPRPWRSILKTARRALRRLFSFSCLRGQREE